MTDFLLRAMLGSALILSFVFSFVNVYGNPGSTEEAVREIERRQFEIERKLREQEKLRIEKRHDKERTMDTETLEDDNKFYINEILLENDGLLSRREKDKILESYIDKNISYNDITVLVRTLTNVLIDKGYVTARVRIPLEQNISSGKLKLVIINGYIEKIVPEKEGLRERMQVFGAFPFFEGKYLNIKDLDYGVEQMNRLHSNNSSMKIFPGEKEGSSKIVIFNEPSRRISIDSGVDNLGQKNTGELRGKLSIGLDNIVSFNDNLYFDYTGTLEDYDRNYSRSYTLFFNFPLGYWLFSTTYSRSEYMQYISGLNREFESSGNDESIILSFDRLLWSYKNNRIKAKSSMILKSKKNFIEDAKIEGSSRNLAIGKVGVDFSTFLYGGYFSSGLLYYRGTNFFNAYKDRKGLGDDVPKAQFNKYEITLVWNRQFLFFNRNAGYSFYLNGQYGMETLYSSEKISIGDYNTVRGFKDYSISGDRGFYLRNEFSINDFSDYWRYLKGAGFFIGYDYGYAREKTGMGANEGRGEASVMGWCAGINYSTELASFAVTYSRQLFSPWFIPKKAHVVYFTSTFSITRIYDSAINFVKKIHQ